MKSCLAAIFVASAIPVAAQNSATNAIIRAELIVGGHGSDLLVGDDGAAGLLGDLDWEAV